MGGGHGPFSPAFGLGMLPSFSFVFLVLKLMISKHRRR